MLAYLEAKDLRLDQRKGLAVDLDKALALLLREKVSVCVPDIFASGLGIDVWVDG